MNSPSTPSKKPFLQKWQRWLLITVISAGVSVWGGKLLVGTMLDRMWRSKTSRTRSDFRSIARAIEAYQSDHQKLPAWSSDPDKNAFILTRIRSETEIGAVPTFAHYDLEGNPLATLTTPVGYLTSHFTDVYSSMRGAPFAYWSFESESGENASGWILWSRGVDTHHDITLELLQSLHAKHGSAILSHPSLIERMYDPTNGGISNGDICMTSVMRRTDQRAEN